MIRHRLHLLAFATLAAMTTAIHGESPSIAELAPRETFLVAGVDDVNASLERLKGTGLWELWQSEDLRAMREAFDEQMEEGPGGLLEQFDLDEEDLTWPEGAVGIALFMGTDPAGGMPVPGFLVAADYGDAADEAGELIEAVKRAIDQRTDMSYEEQDVRGRTVISFDLSGPEPAPAVRDPFAPAPVDDFDMDEGDPMAEVLETLHVVRDKSLFMVSSDLETLHGALERCDGEGSGLAQRPDYQGLIGQLGEHEAFGAVLIAELMQLVAGADPMGMAMMLMPMIQQVVGDIQGIGMGFRLDTPEAMVEQTFTAYMPYGKAGITSLLENASAFGDVPTFVGPNTISYSETSFDFAGLPAALQPVVQMFMMMAPPPQAGNGPTVPELIEQAAGCFGEKIYAIQTLDRPLDAHSLRQVVAIECPKPREFEELMQALGAGLEGRDFVGHRIYTIDIDMGGMMPMDVPVMPTEPPAIGLGGGYLFAGPTSSVEQSLRSIGHEDNATLASDPSFRRALATLGSGRAVGWGYTNLVDSAEASFHMHGLQMEQMKGALQEQGVDMAEWDGEDAMLDAEWMKAIDAAFIRDYIGPLTWKMTATEEGFIVRSYLLGAAPTE